MTAGIGASLTGAAAEPLEVGPWSLAPGDPVPPYGQPSKFEQKVVRTLANPKLEPRSSAARTPHHRLNGTITPNGLHFVIARGGQTEIDPDKHRLAIHGLVKQPMVYTVEALHRYPMVSRVSFVECGGNSAPLYSKEPIQADVQALHGLCSCAEWTGVKLSTLLEETGIDPRAKWFIAEGADLPTMNRSIPLAKAMDDAMIALYQNGEAINPSNGYPMRLLLPGYEGNMNVKWLRRIKLVEAPVMAINETKQYTILLPSGKAWQFYFPPIARAEREGAGLLRGLRHRLFRQRSHQQGRRVGRRWQELGAGGAAGAGLEQGIHALPHGLELGRRAGDPAKPCDGRGRQRAADPRGVPRGAWRA
jgi:sulfane dehydrogenase subunit SoxC